jgi:hypothetical protein
MSRWCGDMRTLFSIRPRGAVMPERVTASYEASGRACGQRSVVYLARLARVT